MKVMVLSWSLPVLVTRAAKPARANRGAALTPATLTLQLAHVAVRGGPKLWPPSKSDIFSEYFTALIHCYCIDFRNILFMSKD